MRTQSPARLASLALLLAALSAEPLAAQTPASAGKLPLTPEQALDLRSFSDLHFSPDGDRVALVVFEPPKAAVRARHIWMLDVRTHELRQFTNSAKTESSPRWSPDGKTLAFLSDREGTRQLYFISAEGGEAERVTEGKRAISSFEWSPDGKQIAFLAADAKTDAEEKKDKDKDDARSVDRDSKHARVWLLDVSTKKIAP